MTVPGRPSKIGKYDVVEVLGEGGMGAVYKAIDPRIGRTVAIKVIKGDFAEDLELRKRFDTEAKAVGNLQHPNIVVVYEFGEEHGNPYLVMQFLDGTPLDKIIAQRQNLPIIQKLEIVIEVLNALHYAHQNGIIHRDVKPANVLLLKDGHIKLLDFGIARQGNLNQTKTGQMLGTMTYMSPEQLNEEVADARSDVYSTGIVLFELLTFSLPFEARDRAALVAKRFRGDPPPPLSKYFENYPVELDDIIARSMMRDRDERYNTADDFAFDLGRVQERLKRDMVGHFVDEARASIAKSDLAKAKELLSQVLKIDTQNPTAKQLFYEVQQALQKIQRGERIQQLRLQAEGALSTKQLDEAASLVEQAIKIDQTDPDLLELREQIQEARSRAQQVKKLLNLANVLQQSGEYSDAQKAVNKALVLDPDDTDAKVLQASIGRLLVEHEKQNRIPQLLQVARREIAARQFQAARDNINNAKAIDPTHPEIPGLDHMIVAGQEQEKRRNELQQVCTEIERRLLENNLGAARELSGSALRKFPGEQQLVRLKAAADEAFEQQERRVYIEEHIASASRLVEEGQASNALKLLQDAERAFPTDTRIREYLQVVRDAAAREVAEREMKGILLRARSALRRKSFAEAIDVLEPGLIQFPAEPEMRDLLETARQEFKRLNQQKQVEEVSKQARELLESRAHTDAIGLLERTAAQVSDPDLVRLLEYARQEAANYRAGLRRTTDEATQMLNSGRHAEALRFLEAKASTYGNSAEFQVLLEQTRRQVDEAQQAKRRILREAEEARTLIRAGDLYGAEAILRACQAEAPYEPEVRALAVKIEEEKKGLELKRQDEARSARDHQQRDAEVERAAASNQDASTRIFQDAAEPQVPPTPGADSRFGMPSSDVESSSPQSSATDMFAAAEAKRADQLPSRRQSEFTEVQTQGISPKKEFGRAARTAEPVYPASEQASRFPSPAESEGKQRTPLPPKPGPGRRLIVIAMAAVVVIAALTVGIMIVGRPPKVAYLKITGAPPGASVTVDNKVESLGSEGLIKVSPGTHPIQISADNYRTKTESVTVEAGRTEVVHAMLVPNPPPPPPPQGTLLVQSSDIGADIFVDGQPKGMIGRNRKESLKLDPGKHRIQLKKSGYQDSQESEVDIVAKTEAKVPFKPLTEIVSKTFLVIDSNPRGASVRVGDKAAGAVNKGPLKVKVNPGTYIVQVNKEGYEPWISNKVTIKEDQELPIFAVLKKASIPSVSFTATPTTIKRGDKAQLKWETQNTFDISIDHGGGTSRSPSGTQEVQPAETTTYTLTATGPGGSAIATAKVIVTAPPSPAPEVASFDVDPPKIELGQSATLKWQTHNATEARISGFDKVFDPNGSLPVHPNENTTYKLTAKGDGGTSPSKDATVVVNQPLKTEQPSPKPEPSSGSIASSADDVAGIRAALERFKDEYEGVVANEFHSVGVQRVTLDEKCDGLPRINEDTAEWSCRETVTYVAKGQRPNSVANTIVFKFRKIHGNWAVDRRSGK